MFKKKKDQQPDVEVVDQDSVDPQSVEDDEPEIEETPAQRRYRLRRLKAVQAVLLAITLLVSAAYVGANVYVKSQGATASIMKTGSMTPALATGSLVITKPADVASFEVGDLIGFQQTSDSMLKVHRVDATDGTTITTKGDFLQDPDVLPVTEEIYSVNEVIYGDHTSGYLWSIAPYLIGALILATAWSFVSSTRERAIAWAAIFLALGGSFGLLRTGAIVSTETVGTTMNESTKQIDVLLINTGIVPIDVASPQGEMAEEHVAVAASQPVHIMGKVGAKEVHLAAKPSISWQFISLVFVPWVFGLALFLLTWRRRREDEIDPDVEDIETDASSSESSSGE